MTKKQFSLLIFLLVIGFLILFIRVDFLCKNINAIQMHTIEQQNKKAEESTSDGIEFIYTDQEQEDIARLC